MKDIVRCAANDNFTDFYLTDGSKKTICRTLKFYEEVLSQYDFVRIHKSHMINLNYVTKYIKGKGGEVVLKNGVTISVSASRKQDFLDRFGMG